MDFKPKISEVIELEIYQKKEKLEKTKVVQEQKICPRQRRQKMLSFDCTPVAKIYQKLSPHLRKWERCDLGGKHRARYCHLLLDPPFRLTPNEAKGGSPYKIVSMALKLLKCFD